jgi:hypothetical protein
MFSAGPHLSFVVHNVLRLTERSLNLKGHVCTPLPPEAVPYAGPISLQLK